MSFWRCQNYSNPRTRVFLLFLAVAPMIVSPGVLRLSRHDQQAISMPRRTERRYLGSSQEILVLKPGYHSLVWRYAFRFFHSSIADALRGGLCSGFKWKQEAQLYMLLALNKIIQEVRCEWTIMKFQYALLHLGRGCKTVAEISSAWLLRKSTSSSRNRINPVYNSMQSYPVL